MCCDTDKCRRMRVFPAVPSKDTVLAHLDIFSRGDATRGHARTHRIVFESWPICVCSGQVYIVYTHTYIYCVCIARTWTTRGASICVERIIEKAHK